MVKLTFLRISKFNRKYNDTLRKKLTAANIPFTEQSSKYGHNLFVSETDHRAASIILLSTPFK